MNEGVAARKLVVEKQNHTILDSLSFDIRPGVLTGLIGPSGSGKTTLMRTIVGLQKPTYGDMTINGEKVGATALRSKIGYVTQAPAIYTDLTVRQNLSYFAKLMKVSSENVQKTLVQVDLQKQDRQLVSTLSGGQQARVSLAIALLGNPQILIFDEPTVGLDPVVRLRLWRVFRQLADQGKIILISSHVMDEAEKCENILLLRDGKLLWSDTRQGLLKETGTRSVEAAFLKIVGGK
jgi:ABC-2 type transport system ATP-binding protein